MMHVFAMVAAQVSADAIVQALWGVLLMTGVVGLASTFLMQWVKKGIAFIDGLHPALKQILVVVIAQALAQLGALLGVSLPGDLGGLDAPTLQGLIGAGFAMGLHGIFKVLGLFGSKDKV